MKTKVIQIGRHGEAEVLESATVEVGEPGPGEVLIRQTAIGLNFAAVYQRRGDHGPHDAAPFPIILGSQGAGVVEAVGPGVDHLKPGDEVGCIQPGSYAEFRLAPAWRVAPLPAGISADLAAAWLLRGMTAEYLLKRLYPLRRDEVTLIHAAAGGMGCLLAQWARALGARVIGTVGSDAKVAVARGYGCHEVINYSTEDFVTRTLEIASEGVHVVYDAVGKAVFVSSLACLRPRGMAINFGTASGNVEGFDLQLLHHKSLTVCRPTLRSFIATPAEFQASAADFFAATARGDIRLEAPRVYDWDEVRNAHGDLEGRRTTGAVILRP